MDLIWLSRAFLGNVDTKTQKLFSHRAAATGMDGDVVRRYKKTVSFLSFPYVCPEPVLVKRLFLYKNG
eukprot:COSAG06_NODE_2642_length_6517_cov_33.378778_5_plen_68_part_00